jgi:hypothetical protein
MLDAAGAAASDTVTVEITRVGDEPGLKTLSSGELLSARDLPRNKPGGTGSLLTATA